MLDKHRKRKPKDRSLGLKRSGIRLSKYVDYRYYRFFAPKKVDRSDFYFYFCFLSSAKKRNVFDSRVAVPNLFELCRGEKKSLYINKLYNQTITYEILQTTFDSCIGHGDRFIVRRTSKTKSYQGSTTGRDNPYRLVTR